MGVAVPRRPAAVPGGVRLDLSASGRGRRQILVLSRRADNPDSALLPRRPDARLKVLGQREISNQLGQTAATSGSRVFAASHSEAIANEATGRDTSILLLAQPHRVDAVPVRADGASGFTDGRLSPGGEIPSAG
ncbi:MAG: hypothetical protein OXT72_05260 [Gammaproteobacteria bacterium]|nr:hypothetical protein [Gammaproteobacteria bacterium]MDE0248273.1 hypothetical protein [Gammaproteobacteria bacterium]